MNGRSVCSARPRANLVLAVVCLSLLCGGSIARAENLRPSGDFLGRLLREFGRATESGNGEREFLDPELVERTAGDVFASPEFRALPHLDLEEGVPSDSTQSEPMTWGGSESSQPADAVEASIGGFASLLSGLVGSISSILVVLLGFVIVAGLVAVLVFVARTWRRSEGAAPVGDDAADEPDSQPLVAPGEKSADAWLAAARAAATAGRFEQAVSLLLLGAMGHTEHAGFIRFRRGLTHRDYLRGVPRDSAWHEALRRLIRTYAPIGFGRRGATVQTFNDVLAPYEAALAAEPLAASGGQET